MSCEDIPSLLDLQKVKKHAEDFGRLMGTGTGTSANEVTGQVRPTYNKVINDMNSEFDGMIVDMNSEFDQQIQNLGYTRVGTFASGATLLNGRQTLLWDVADGGDGQEYGWSGSFPPSGKVVPPGSTPLTTGGIAVGAWMSRFDPALRVQTREALRRSYAEAGYNLVAGSFEAGGTLVDANDVLLHEASGKAFSGPAGTVAAGTNPASGGFVDKSGVATSASAISNANGGSVQDFIDKVEGGDLTVIAEGTTTPRRLGERFADAVNVKDFGAVGDSDATDEIQAALNQSRNVSLMGDGDLVLHTNKPIKLRSMTRVQGNGQRSASIGSSNTVYSGVIKTNNSTVVITNPERPTQTVDCMFYTNGEWEDGYFPQKFKITDAAFRSDSPSVDSTFIYQIQGSSMNLENVDIRDFAYAVDSLEMWSSYFKKVITNGKMSFKGGTSIVLDQCTSGGSGNNGLTSGGFFFQDQNYCTLTSCTSDGTPNTAYTFDRSAGIVMNGCGAEVCDSGSDSLGHAIHFQSASVVINGFACLSKTSATQAPFSLGGFSNIIFNGGSSYIGVPGNPSSGSNYDLVVTGSGSYLEFNRYRFHNGTHENPKIRFEAGVISSTVLVKGVNGRITRYVVDGSGVLTVNKEYIERGINENGEWVRHPDGTAECWITLPKTVFLPPTPIAPTVVQGLNLYRSNVTTWSLPIPMLAGTKPNIQIQPLTSTSGSRLVWARHTSDGASATSSGQIQLLSLEEFLAGSNGYEMLQGVEVRAIGRWK